MNPTPYKPEHKYTVEEFIAHFDFLSKVQFRGRGRFINLNEVILPYFLAQYPSCSEGRYKMNRFGAAMAYLFKYADRFEEFVVMGEHGALIFAPIVLALWQTYAGVPEAILCTEPDLGIVLELAKAVDLTLVNRPNALQTTLGILTLTE